LLKTCYRRSMLGVLYLEYHRATLDRCNVQLKSQASKHATCTLCL
jgi:hypothetical protein